MNKPVLFYFPRACSLAAHIALEESDTEYEKIIVDLRKGENTNQDYLRLNPTGAIPALVYGDFVLTETHAILTFIGDVISQGKLLPEAGNIKRYQAHEWINFLSSSVHTYIRSIFRSSVYAGEDPHINHEVAKQGKRNLSKAILTVEKRLPQTGWALGDEFSVVDCYLFIMYLWTTDERVGNMPERPKWSRLARRIWEREGVKRVVEFEQQFRNYEIPL